MSMRPAMTTVLCFVAAALRLTVGLMISSESCTCASWRCFLAEKFVKFLGPPLYEWLWLADAYDLFCISLVTKLLGRIYYTDQGKLPPNVAAAMNGVAPCGTLAGQFFFGWLGDKLGRKSIYGMTLLLMVICSIAMRF